MKRVGHTPLHDAAASNSRTTAGGCGLFRPGSQAVIGVLGNSIAWGHNVPAGSNWPSLLNRSLRAKFGPGVTVVNGAVRASTPDFASLCWAEIWGSRRAPRLDVAVVECHHVETLVRVRVAHPNPNPNPNPDPDPDH